MLETIASISILVLLTLVLLAAILIISLGLPGTLVILVTAFVFVWAATDSGIPWGFLLLLAALAVLAEIVESLLGLVTARKYGASRWGVLGTLVGGFGGSALGATLFGLLGVVPGAVVGSFAGAFLMEYVHRRDRGVSLRAGLGGFLGRMLAALFKTAVAVAMAALLLRRAFLELWNPGA